MFRYVVQKIVFIFQLEYLRKKIYDFFFWGVLKLISRQKEYIFIYKANF